MERTLSLPAASTKKLAAGHTEERKKSGFKLPSISSTTLISVGTVAAIIGVWTAVSVSGKLSSRVIPDIRAVIAAIVSISTDGYKGATLLGHLSASFYRLFTPFFLAIVTAIPLGLISGQNAKIRALLEPIVEFVKPLPPLAYYTVLSSGWELTTNQRLCCSTWPASHL